MNERIALRVPAGSLGDTEQVADLGRLEDLGALDIHRSVSRNTLDLES